MKIKEKLNGKNLTLFLEGDFDDTGYSIVEQKFNEVINWEVDDIAFNMKRVKYISSFGIRVLILAHKRAIKLGKKVVLTEMSDKVRGIIEMVGILPMLNGQGVMRDAS
jgi:anti-anti-sigma factor